jgi:serine/threonine-protein kinase
VTDPLRARLEAALARTHVITGELGRGGMGVVYRAWERDLEREVAIKVLPFGAGHAPEATARFLREARIAARLAHPNIVVVHGAGQAGDLCWFAMALVNGIPLDALLDLRGALAVDEVRWLLLQAARALVHAHVAGVVHRDLKPANLLLSLGGTLVVSDFGIARSETGPSSTLSGMVIGTPAYMSPEQVLGRVVTPASDQYALGVVAYHLLAGRLPFEGDAFTMQLGHVKEAPPPLDALRGGLPSTLVGAVQRMLAKEPEARFPSIEALLPILSDGVALDGGEAARRLAHDVRAHRHAAGDDVATPHTPASPPPVVRPPKGAALSQWQTPAPWTPGASTTPEPALIERPEQVPHAKRAARRADPVPTRVATPPHRTPEALAQEAVARARAQLAAVRRDARRADRGARPSAPTLQALRRTTARRLALAAGTVGLVAVAATLTPIGPEATAPDTAVTANGSAEVTEGATGTPSGAGLPKVAPDPLSYDAAPQGAGGGPAVMPPAASAPVRGGVRASGHPAVGAVPGAGVAPAAHTAPFTVRPEAGTSRGAGSAPVPVPVPSRPDAGRDTSKEAMREPPTPAPVVEPRGDLAAGPVREAVSAWVQGGARDAAAVRDFLREGVNHAVRLGDVREVARDADGVDLEFDLLLERRNAIGVAQSRRATVRARAVRRGDDAVLERVAVGALVRR